MLKLLVAATVWGRNSLLWAPDGTITTFDAPVVGYTSANSINPAGEVAGFHVDTTGVTFHGFLRSPSTRSAK